MDEKGQIETSESTEPSDDSGFTSRSLRSFSDLHADTWQVVRHNLVVFLLVPVVVWFPIDLLTEMIAQAGQDDFWSYTRAYYRISRITEFFVGGWLAALILTGARQLAEGSTVSLGGVLSEGSKRYGQVLGVIFSFGWRVGIATLLLVVPGIILSLGYAVCLPTAIFEGHRGRDALESSEAYMKGGRWKLLKYVVLAALLYLPGAFGISFLIPEEETPLISALLSIPFNVLGVLFTIGLVMVYADATGNPDLARPVGAPAPQEGYIAQARGRVEPRSLVRVVLAISLLLFAAGSYRLIAETTSELDKITFGTSGDEIYYGFDVDEAEVRKMGDALMELGYFGSEEAIAVTLLSDDTSYFLYLYIEQESWTDSELLGSLQHLQYYLSSWVMEKPVQIIMTQKTASGWEKMPVGESID